MITNFELKQLFNSHHELNKTIQTNVVPLIEACETLERLSELYALLCELNADEDNQLRELPGDIYVLFLAKKSQLKEKANDLNT